MGFTPEFLDDLRSRLNLADVVGRRIRLTRKGREHLGLCPFHNEKTPSFTLNDEKGFYHCFGCGAHGDIIEFVMKTEGLSFPETVERLAADAGMAMPVQDPRQIERDKERHSLREVTELAGKWFAEQLSSPAAEPVREYLTRRGLDAAAIATFSIGFAPPGRTALKSALMGKGVPEAALVTAGLIIQPENGKDSYDRFRERVIFPITDKRGRVVAFGGRALKDDPEKRIPKYLNSPETPLFHKGRLLYAFHQARPKMFESGEVLITEGYMDVIALHQAGFTHAVAPLGTALTEDQMRELWSVVDEPTLCFDGDTAGQRAAFRAAERALPILVPGKSLKFGTLPPGEDPDSLLKAKGNSAMEAVIAAAKPLSELIWALELAGGGADTPERRAHLEKRLEDRARTIGERKVQDQYARFFREKLYEAFGPQRGNWSSSGKRPGGMGKSWPAKGYGKSGSKGYGASFGGAPHSVFSLNAGEGVRGTTDANQRIEGQLLALAVAHCDSLLDEVMEDLGETDFLSPDLDNLRIEILKLSGVSGLDKEAFRDNLNKGGFKDLVDGLLSEGSIAPYVCDDAPLENVRALWRHTLKRYRKPLLEAQCREAKQACDTTGTQEDTQRYLLLKRQLLEYDESSADEDEIGALSGFV